MEALTIFPFFLFLSALLTPVSNLLVFIFSYLFHSILFLPLLSLLSPSVPGLQPVSAYGNISECGFSAYVNNKQAAERSLGLQ